jgi:hypothetical protein
VKRLPTYIAGPLVLMLPLALSGQEERPLTSQAASAAAMFYNAATTSRGAGPIRIARGTDVNGDLAALGGPLSIAGTVQGDVLVINGDVRLDIGGRITGALTVIGGSITGQLSEVGGPVIVYPESLRFRREQDRIIALDPTGESLLSRPTWFGRGELILRVEGAYNRVEGLPIALGARFELGHSNPTVFDARFVYRTGNGLQFHPDELGHGLRIEQFMGGHRTVRLGVGWYRQIDPIEPRGVTDLESSLSTFALHKDLRDHYDRNGWHAYLAYSGRTRPVEARLEYRDERHNSIASRNPWSLLDNNDDWRVQPQVASGEIRLVRGWLRWDTRNNPEDPSAGWLLEAGMEQGVDGDLQVLRENPDPGGVPPLIAQGVNEEYTAIRLEARRYLRLGPRSRVALRAVATGSPDDGPLPPQRQHVLGGVGSLPGYSNFAFDCGARSQPRVDGLAPYYGCDRAVLVQAEYRFAFTGSSGLSVGRRLGLDFEIATTPELVVFTDAGRAWIEPESLGDRGGLGPVQARYDAGVGIRFGRVGLYVAMPLSGESADGPNFFVRLGPRI